MTTLKNQREYSVKKFGEYQIKITGEKRHSVIKFLEQNQVKKLSSVQNFKKSQSSEGLKKIPVQ